MRKEDRPTRLLLVLHRGGLAGTEWHVLWLAQGMRERGWDVRLGVSEEGPILAHFDRAGVERFQIVRRRGFDGLYGWQLGRLARRLRADVLHVHSGRLAAAAGRVAGIRAVIETRHGLGPLGGRPTLQRLRWEARRCRFAHRTLTVCRSDRERLLAGGLPEERVVCVANGIPRRSAPIRPARSGPVRLGYLGRLVPSKGPRFLARLAPSLERRIPEGWNLTIAGEGPERVPLARAFAKMGLAERVFWLGEIEGPEGLLERCDLLCVPSEHEGQPLSLLEAMQIGVVPIARRLPSLEELLGGDPAAGILLPPDPEAWASAIVELGKAPDRWAGLSQEGQRRIERDHRLETMLERVERVYLDCFASGGGR